MSIIRLSGERAVPGRTDRRRNGRTLGFSEVMEEEGTEPWRTPIRYNDAPSVADDEVDEEEEDEIDDDLDEDEEDDFDYEDDDLFDDDEEDDEDEDDDDFDDLDEDDDSPL